MPISSVWALSAFYDNPVSWLSVLKLKINSLVYDLGVIALSFFSDVLIGGSLSSSIGVGGQNVILSYLILFMSLSVLIER